MDDLTEMVRKLKGESLREYRFNCCTCAPCHHRVCIFAGAGNNSDVVCADADSEGDRRQPLAVLSQRLRDIVTLLKGGGEAAQCVTAPSIEVLRELCNDPLCKRVRTLLPSVKGKVVDFLASLRLPSFRVPALNADATRLCCKELFDCGSEDEIWEAPALGGEKAIANDMRLFVRGVIAMYVADTSASFDAERMMRRLQSEVKRCEVFFQVRAARWLGIVCSLVLGLLLYVAALHVLVR
jgi:hypothetical protein